MTIRECASSELLGLLILAEFPEPDTLPTIHLGYLLSESAWGQGYATELLAGLIDWYIGVNKNVQLLGGVETDNIASAKVLQKNDFVVVPELSDASTQMFRRVV